MAAKKKDDLVGEAEKIKAELGELKQKKDVIPFNYSYFTTCQEIFQNLKKKKKKQLD